MSELIIFTDGASRGNPGPGGWGAIIASDSEATELGGRESHTTNNRMELMAAIQALEFVSKLKADSYTPKAILHTDSSYVLKGATLWLSGWKNNGFKTKGRNDVLNRDLWERLGGVIEKLSVTWKLLPGHSGVPANERCDEIATMFADAKSPTLYDGSRESYGVDLETIVAMHPKDNKKKKKSSGKTYSYVSMVNGKVETHLTWAECEKRVKGVSGARFKKSQSADDESAIISSWKQNSRHS
jgi:ribonuclease HI